MATTTLASSLPTELRDVIYLRCIQQGSKLRIKFESYIDHDGQQRVGVYDNTLNCQFPRAIRKVGRRYMIPSTHLSLTEKGYYHVRSGNITVFEPNESSQVQLPLHHQPPAVIFDGFAECCVCLDVEPEQIFAPCGHACCCSGCIPIVKNTCPLCRRHITHSLPIQR